MLNILFTICGRAGSKGIKNKNIRNFLGHPLPLYTVSAIDLYCSRHPEFSVKTVVNSDSDELLDIACSAIEAYKIKRVEALSGDTVSKIDVINDCLVQLEKLLNTSFDIVVDLDITSPLRTIKDIENLIEKKLSTRADVVYSVVESRRNPYFNMVMKTKEGYKKVCKSCFVTRQQAPQIYDMNASMYAYEPEFLRTGKGVLDGYGEIITMYDTGVLDLDHEHDFELMEVIAKYLYEKDEQFAEIRNNIVK